MCGFSRQAVIEVMLCGNLLKLAAWKFVRTCNLEILLELAAWKLVPSLPFERVLFSRFVFQFIYSVLNVSSAGDGPMETIQNPRTFFFSVLEAI